MTLGQLIAFLVLSSASCAQTLYAPGCKPTDIAVGQLETPTLRAQVAYSGGMFGLQVLGADGQWAQVGPLASHAPQSSMIDHGSCQMIWTASNPLAPERRFVHHVGCNPRVANGTEYVACPQEWVSFDAVEEVIPDDLFGRLVFDAGGEWRSAWRGRDSLHGMASPPLIEGVTTLKRSDLGSGIWRVTSITTATRTSAQPRWNFDRSNALWTTIDASKVNYIKINGVDYLTSEIPMAPGSISETVAVKDIWVALKSPVSKFLRFQWSDGLLVRAWRHNPVNTQIILTAIHQGPGAEFPQGVPVTRSFSLEVR